MKKKNGYKYRPLSTHVLFAEVIIVAVGQIFDEEDPDQIKFFEKNIRAYYSDQDYPFVLEAIQEVKNETKGTNIKRVQFIASVNRRYEEKLEKRIKERNRRKNLKKRRAKKRKGGAKSFSSQNL